jgi:hypothetical protein
MTIQRRRVHFGIDYGTSNSKLVVRDFAAAGGERAHVVLRANGERLSSSVAVVGDEMFFGRRPATRSKTLQSAAWYESVKMRAAAEVAARPSQFFRGPAVPWPPRLRAVDVAALTVWWLIGQAYEDAEEVVRCRSGETLAPGMTMGIPMGFFADAPLQKAFVGISRVGWVLFRRQGRIKDSRIKLDVAREYLSEAWRIAEEDPIPDDEVRLWVRTEAEAALWWACRSPQVAAGPYCKVDVGAGTTSSSVFRIVGGKEKMAFFGAASVPTGMDAVDEALCTWKGMEPSQIRTLRGEEEQILTARGALVACRSVFDGMREALALAWRQNGALIRGAIFEQRAWQRQAGVFLLGGGSLVDEVRKAMSQRPAALEGSFPVIRLESPPDLRLSGRAVSQQSLPFVLVAYGLSMLAPPIPMVETPDQVPPMPKTGTTIARLDHEDIYAR